MISNSSLFSSNPQTPMAKDLNTRAPHTPPPFTLSQLKKTIPPHCFNRSLLRSFSHLLHDLFFVSFFSFIATSYFHHLPHPLPYLAWPLYWLIQGCTLFAFGLIGHDCGHHAFSNHKWLDDTVGFLVHSAILLPYFSFKYSHRRHHSNTGSIHRDEAFVPKTRAQLPWFVNYLNNPPGRVLTIGFILITGFPLYLGCNILGRPYDGFACHYYPYSPIYSKNERVQIFISDAGVFVTIFVLYKLVLAKGLSWVLCLYGVPLVVVSVLLVLTTYLQHTHSALPHYGSAEWEWLRGALSTVDRDFGVVLNRVFHNLTNTHVVHHLFPSIPHYNAMEATEAVRPMLGEYYRFDETPIVKALWREAKECVFVEPDDDDEDGVFWYKNKL